MTAGVQNIESAGYLPPSPPSTPSSDAKAPGTADRQVSGTQGEPQNFQSELERQNTAAKEVKPTGRPENGSARSGSAQSGKKRDTRTDDSNPTVVTTVPVTEPAKQIQPLVLALPTPDEPAQPDGRAENPAQPDGRADKSAQQGVPEQPPSVATLPQLPDGALSAMAFSLAAQVLPQPAAQSGDQATASAGSGASSENQPVSAAALKLSDAMPPEPVAAAVQETVDSAPSSASALAFAGRMAAVPHQADAPVSGDPSPDSAAPASPTPARIPMRYAATAQILPSDNLGSKPDAGSQVDRASQISARTDMVLPRIEAASQPASSSGPSGPREVVPTARLEQVIEPPAATPTSPHDIRVQVPDNKGGSTQVRFVESDGEVRVSVRTADEALAQNLRGHLNDLTQRLADGGMPAEFWKPSSASSQNNQQQPDREGRGSGGQQSGGQSGQQDRQQKRPAWLEEMEASLQGPEAKR